jgi:hypothetical protein
MTVSDELVSIPSWDAAATTTCSSTGAGDATGSLGAGDSSEPGDWLRSAATMVPAYCSIRSARSLELGLALDVMSSLFRRVLRHTEAY